MPKKCRTSQLLGLYADGKLPPPIADILTGISRTCRVCKADINQKNSEGKLVITSTDPEKCEKYAQFQTGVSIEKSG